jgi:tetratricopeptide (TPR) repeat protein
MFQRFFLIALLSHCLIIISCKQQPITGTSDQQLVELNAAIEKNGKDPSAYIARAEYFIQQERIGDALADINKALELEPDHIKANLALSNLMIMQGKPQQALELLNKVTAIDAGNVDAHLRKARLYLVMKDYNNCAASVEKILSLDPLNADAFYLKGVALDENGESAKAVEAFRRAVMYQPAHYDALMQLGFAFTDSNPSMAIDYFSGAARVDSSSQEALYNLGLLYQENEQPERALETYALMLKNDSMNKLALFNSGYVNLVYLKEFSLGADFFSKAIRSDSIYTDAFYNRGYCYELTGDFTRARQDYLQVLQQRVNDPKAAEALGRIDRKNRK